MDHAIAILVGLFVPLAAAVTAARRGAPAIYNPAEKRRLYWMNSASLWFLALLSSAAWRLSGEPLARLGLTAPSISGSDALLALVVILAIAGDTGFQMRNPRALDATRARWRRDTPFMPETSAEYASYLVMALSAAVCEEVVFRGFLIRYLQDVLPAGSLNAAAAIALPALVFGVSHWYQGPARSLKIVLLGIGLGMLFVSTNSLVVSMAVHLAIDLGNGAAGLRLAAAHGPNTTPIAE